ncbi:DDE-type integrase/transposase/recombinase, partial [Paraburkholderia humisilvae]
ALAAMPSGGKHAARKLKRAQVLLAAHAGRMTRALPPLWRLANLGVAHHTATRGGAARAGSGTAAGFIAHAANVLWIADATNVPTDAGFLYLAVMPDVVSRHIVGWAMSNHLYTELMLCSLDMALQQRRYDGVILHSNQGRPIHVHCLWAALPRSRRAAVNGHGW